MRRALSFLTLSALSLCTGCIGAYRGNHLSQFEPVEGDPIGIRETVLAVSNELDPQDLAVIGDRLIFTQDETFETTQEILQVQLSAENPRVEVLTTFPRSFALQSVGTFFGTPDFFCFNARVADPPNPHRLGCVKAGVPRLFTLPADRYHDPFTYPHYSQVTRRIHFVTTVSGVLTHFETDGLQVFQSSAVTPGFNFETEVTRNSRQTHAVETPAGTLMITDGDQHSLRSSLSGARALPELTDCNFMGNAERESWFVCRTDLAYRTLDAQGAVTFRGSAPSQWHRPAEYTPENTPSPIFADGSWLYASWNRGLVYLFNSSNPTSTLQNSLDASGDPRSTGMGFPTVRCGDAFFSWRRYYDTNRYELHRIDRRGNTFWHGGALEEGAGGDGEQGCLGSSFLVHTASQIVRPTHVAAFGSRGATRSFVLPEDGVQRRQRLLFSHPKAWLFQVLSSDEELEPDAFALLTSTQ
jgi:hypothetical protein